MQPPETAISQLSDWSQNEAEHKRMPGSKLLCQGLLTPLVENHVEYLRVDLSENSYLHDCYCWPRA